MAFTFNTTPGETIARELLIAYLNTGTASEPVWSPLGKRTTDSSEEYDWSEETSQDILGNTYTTMKKPTITQSFDPWDLDGGDAAQQKIHQLAVIEQNAQALPRLCSHKGIDNKCKIDKGKKERQHQAYHSE